MKNIKLTIQYDGRAYHGSQIQPKVPTIQGEIEKGLSKLFNKTIETFFAGRTDSGVHSYGQVANFIADFSIPIQNIKKAANNLLPDDIYICQVEEMPLDFHARFSPSTKKYIYKLFVSEDKNLFSKDYYYNLNHCLDFEAMVSASKYLIGYHDFKSFATTGSSAMTTNREIFDIRLSEDTIERNFALPFYNNGKLITIEIHGNGFLYNMVRIIAGTLVEVGLGRIASSKIPVIIDGRDRTLAGHVAPAQGLYLKEIIYIKETI